MERAYELVTSWRVLILLQPGTAGSAATSAHMAPRDASTEGDIADK